MSIQTFTLSFPEVLPLQKAALFLPDFSILTEFAVRPASVGTKSNIKHLLMLADLFQPLILATF